MTQYTKPTVLPAWGESAGGADVLQPSNAEIQAGWPLTNVPPSRKRFNWILKYLAQGVRYLMQMGIPLWDTAEDYPVGARVLASDGKTYKCIQTGINKDPTTQTAYWTRWGFTLAEIAAEQTTPAQFDNTTKTATTAFLRQAGLQQNGMASYSATGNLALADLGKQIMLSFGTAGTLTLPTLASVPAGTVICFFNWGSTSVTLSAQSGQVINSNTSNAQTFVMPPNTTLFLSAETGTSWDIIGGSAQLTTSPLFVASKLSAGYQKLPNGLIIQWGWWNNTSAYSTGTWMNVPFTIAFPNACLMVIPCNAFSTPSNAPTLTTQGSPGTSSFPCSSSISAAISGLNIQWVAIGY